MLVPISTAAPTVAPCGLSGVQCSGQCGQCAHRPTSGLGFTLPGISSLPAPFNDWRVLVAVAIALLFLFGGGMSLFRRRRGTETGTRRRLRAAQLRYEAERAQEFAARAAARAR